MAVKTVKCDACLQDMPIKLTCMGREQGVNLILCVNPKTCRETNERNGTWYLGKVGQ